MLRRHEFTPDLLDKTGEERWNFNSILTITLFTVKPFRKGDLRNSKYSSGGRDTEMLSSRRETLSTNLLVMGHDVTGVLSTRLRITYVLVR